MLINADECIHQILYNFWTLVLLFLNKNKKNWKLSETCKMLKFRYSFTMGMVGFYLLSPFWEFSLDPILFLLSLNTEGQLTITEKWRTYHCAHNECDTTDESDSLLESYGIIPITRAASRARLNEFMLGSTGTHCALPARDRVLTQVCTFKIRIIILLSIRIFIQQCGTIALNFTKT